MENQWISFSWLILNPLSSHSSTKEKLWTRSSEWKRGWFKECGNPQPSGPRSYEVGKLSIYIGLNSVSLLCGVLVTCTILCACADGYTVNHSQLTFFSTTLFYNISPQFHFLRRIFTFLSPLYATSIPPRPISNARRTCFCSCYCWFFSSTVLLWKQLLFVLNFNYSRSIQIWPFQAQIKMLQTQICVVDFLFFWLIELNNNILICSTV